MKGLEHLVIVAWILFGLYILVFFMVIADLWSGIRKAKQRGELRTSYGYRRTVNKIAKYYNVLLALTVIDIMQIVSTWYLDNYYGYNIPIFPIVTLIGAIGIGLIEIKSIYEKAENKVKNEYHQLGRLISEIAENKTDPYEIAKCVVDYMNNNLIKQEDKK